MDLSNLADHSFTTMRPQSWKEEDITALLDEGEAMLQVRL